MAQTETRNRPQKLADMISEKHSGIDVETNRADSLYIIMLFQQNNMNFDIPLKRTDLSARFIILKRIIMDISRQYSCIKGIW